MNSRTRTVSTILAAALALFAIVMLPATGSTKSKSAIRSYHGKVISVSQGESAFRIKLRGSGSRKRFRVTDATTFEGISGLSGLNDGLAIEVKAAKGGNNRVARKVELDKNAASSTETGNSADDNGSGGNGADDPAGDDHGGGGNGADDAPGDDHGGHHGGNEAGDDHGSGGHGSDD